MSFSINKNVAFIVRSIQLIKSSLLNALHVAHIMAEMAINYLAWLPKRREAHEVCNLLHSPWGLLNKLRIYNRLQFAWRDVNLLPL